MPYPDPQRVGGPCERAREAAEALAEADARCTGAPEVERGAAFAAYRAAFEAFREAEAACRGERMRSRQ